MLSIAEAAGSSRMTLHRRAVTKDALLSALVQALAAEHREAMWHAVTSSEPGGARLRAAVAAELDSTEQNLALLEALDAVSHVARCRTGHGRDRACLPASAQTAP